MEFFGQEINFLELTGTIFGILGVWLTLKENILCFPAGIINVAIYSWLFFHAQLYADSALQLVYIALLIFGWINWSKLKNMKLVVTKSSLNLIVLISLITALSTGIIYLILKNFTDTDVPFFDSLTTSMSLGAQYLIARKKIENWIIWIIVDIIYVPLYIYKNLNFTAFLYFIFILLAIKGYFEWKKSLQMK